MTDSGSVEIKEEHVEALRSFLWGGPGEPALDDNSPTDDFIALSVLLTAVFSIAARRKFSPSYTSADITEYVADIRTVLDENDDTINPHFAEQLLHGALEDTPFEPSGEEDELPALMTLLALLAALLEEADLDEPGKEGLIKESTRLAKKWIAKQQGRPTATGIPDKAFPIFKGQG
ncbi:MAG TPA: hypothetical protein VIL71_06755 [Spirillospora sp.]